MDQEQNAIKVEIVNPAKSGLSMSALILGIIGVCLSFIPIINNAAFALGIIAIVIGVISLVKKQRFKKTIIGIVLGVLAIAITLGMQSAVQKEFDKIDEELSYMGGEKTDDVLENYLDVKCGTFQVVDGEYWSETSLKVTLKNKGDKTASFDVQIEAIDANGARIEMDTIYVNSLAAGQSQTFDIFTLVSSEKYEAMKKATFRVVTASMY